MIKNRKDARLVEKIFKFTPFIDKIEALDLAKFAHNLALKVLKENRHDGYRTYNNKKIQNKIYD